jgi:hypothetical protein
MNRREVPGSDHDVGFGAHRDQLCGLVEVAMQI